MEEHSPFRLSFIDPSLGMILLSNIVSIVLAISQHWSIGQLLWVYWGQSVVIGIINVHRMLNLKEFSTKNLKSNGHPVPETQAAKRKIAAFFAFHYGFFHFIYAVFLLGLFPLTDLSTADLIWIALLIFGFFSSHSFSYHYNLNNDFKQQKPNLGTLMFYPYLRIIPMHLIIIFGTIMDSTTSLIIFMIMKIFADGGMHMVEHHLFRNKKLN